PLERLLPSEWLLAEEFPEEFLRRYTEHELLPLADELRHTTSRRRRVSPAATTCPGNTERRGPPLLSTEPSRTSVTATSTDASAPRSSNSRVPEVNTGSAPPVTGSG
ncbi:hypothetical protein VM98_37750, partial [Streptomyces rubellomurinus subsp. indigoferus]